ncbi:MAG: LPS assembly lipoprotein LptE [Planctomycetota bacterium]
MTRLTAILAALAAVALGCGYSLVDYDAGFGDIRTVAIQTPTNGTFQPGIEYVVADALRREFLRRGAVRLVDDPKTADLVIDGNVRRIVTTGRSFSSIVFTLEYQLVLAVDLEATRPDGTSLFVGRRALEETEFYLASADVEATRKNRDEALRRVAQVIAQRVHDSLLEAAVP